MKNLILLSAIIFTSKAIAQNPFESIGKTTKPMLSLSNGKYVEHFENDSIRQIGSVMINMNTEQIVAFVDRKAQAKKVHSQTSSRFLSIDPIARYYPFLTPYQYASNSPIVNIDLDGLEGYNAVGGGYVTSPPAKCNDCIPISKQEYEQVKKWYAEDKKKGNGSVWEKGSTIYIYQPNGYNDYGKGSYYKGPNQPKLEVTVATKFDGGKYDKVINEDVLDKSLDEFADQLKSYEKIPIIEITTNTGSNTTTKKTGSGDEVYKQDAQITNPDGGKTKGTIGELMEKRGETIKQKLIDRGIPAENIKINKGSHQKDDNNRKADIKAKF